MTTYHDLDRATSSFWRSAPPGATSSRPLTRADLETACDQFTQHHATPTTTIVLSMATLRAAGRGLGYPDLEIVFERWARAAAHTIFGNITIHIPDLVTEEAAGRYALGGAWPFDVASWSAPQTLWGD